MVTQLKHGGNHAALHGERLPYTRRPRQWGSELNRKVKDFVARVRRGEIVQPLYLSYYYTYLTYYDRRHGTNFSNSQAPGEEMGSPDIGGTGNFPAHPRLVRRFLRDAPLAKDDAIIDVGHGSGMVLHVASKMGFTNLRGVEFGTIPYELSVRNLGDRAHLIHGDAREVDLSSCRAMTFFNPFRGDLAVEFFEGLPDSVEVVLTINHDTVIEPVLVSKGFHPEWTYQHGVYKNFNAKLWRLAKAL